MNLDEFLNYYSLNASQIMWLLGAGASRSAGMPSATDIIWDLKRRYYCQKEQRYIADNELSNEAIKAKIQSFLELNGCPPIWSEEEYSYYFKLVFGDDARIHQNYLAEQLDSNKISINSGHRILASLLALGLAKLVFTTNFDTVLENAFSLIEGRELHSFSLDGSVGALNALNDEKFPIYAKMHGDFRYTEMKNLPEHLIENDAEIEKCFINACSRYGLIVSGNSGRDTNVMKALNKAVENINAFPKGLYWVTSLQGNIFPAVTALIDKAKAYGIKASIIDADTFDSLLGRIWKLIGHSYPEYDKKVRRGIYEMPKIDRYFSKGDYPLIRTNAFPIIKMPIYCLKINPLVKLTSEEFKEKLQHSQSAAIMIKEKALFAWGAIEEIYKVIAENEIKDTEETNIEESLKTFSENSLINAFYTRAIARALVKDKPLKLRRKNGKFYLVISSKDESFKQYESLLKTALKTWNYNAKKFVPEKSLAGKIANLDNTFWMECVQLSLEYFDKKFWLVIIPDIWIEPGENRKLAKDFLASRKKYRYNILQSDLLNAWKEVLLGSGETITISPFNNVKYNPAFEIATKTAYSFRSTK